ncbi:hypothetical protein THOM_1838 [Trachipleistophora hominis]|uniref:Ricin B lectin domain-containing protein n=1 Tax=Trachipleistophora hominis TaxID=72359 RepID=L7JV96_TRAHO|nr:hypothetical protein THOM_1838 [Trachipleistophora hominis]
MLLFIYCLMTLTVADDGSQPGVYRMISWKGDPSLKVSLDKGVARIQNRETPQSKEDTATAYFIPLGIVTFKIQYKNGYFCKHDKSPGLIICKNKDDPHTTWNVVEAGDAYQIKTGGLCLKKMGEDKKTGAGGFYMNAAACGNSDIFKWKIDDLKILEENSDVSDDNLEVKGNRMKVRRGVEEVSEPNTLMIGDVDDNSGYDTYERRNSRYYRETFPYYRKEVRTPHYHRNMAFGGSTW